MFGVNSVTVSSTVFFKFESVRRDLVLLLTSFMAENACSHRYVVLKRHIKLWTNRLSSGKCSLGNYHKNLIMCEALGTEESSSNLIFNDECAFKSIRSI